MWIFYENGAMLSTSVLISVKKAKREWFCFYKGQKSPQYFTAWIICYFFLWKFSIWCLCEVLSCGAIILSIKLFHKTLLFYFCTVGPLIWLIFYKCNHSNLQYMPITAVLSLELFLSEWFQKTPLKKHIFMSNHEFYSFIYLICRHFITPVLYGRLFVGLQEDIYLFSIKFLFTLSVKCASTNDIPIFFI